MHYSRSTPVPEADGDTVGTPHHIQRYPHHPSIHSHVYTRVDSTLTSRNCFSSGSWYFSLRLTRNLLQQIGIQWFMSSWTSKIDISTSSHPVNLRTFKLNAFITPEGPKKINGKSHKLAICSDVANLRLVHLMRAWMHLDKDSGRWVVGWMGGHDSCIRKAQTFGTDATTAIPQVDYFSHPTTVDI